MESYWNAETVHTLVTTFADVVLAGGLLSTARAEIALHAPGWVCRSLENNECSFHYCAESVVYAFLIASGCDFNDLKVVKNAGESGKTGS